LIPAAHKLIEARAAAGAQERARLAREIHDGVAQELAGLGYRLDDLATASGLAPHERGEVRQIRLALSEALHRLRRSIFDLRNDEIDFLRELQEFLLDLEATGMKVSFLCDASISDLSEPVARQLHGIAFEALSNVAHHANATRLDFAFADFSDSFQMTIEDDGIGHVGVKEYSYGLVTMQERAELIGATCTIENPATGGTIIRVRAPHQ
jgi:signal transduction histidine kinase